ncbi:MAG: hypothetical protein OES57_13840 [Acidimicrobiia bacterium]|nr:hypothetical protein [Acidimicrobiia bacterium]
MRRLAPFVLVVLFLSACGGGSDASPAPDAGSDAGAVASTTSAVPAPPPLDLGFTDPACDAIGDWLGAIAFGGASADYQGRVAASTAALVEPYGAAVADAVAGGSIDHGAAARIDLETIALCEMPVVEGALVAALHGEPDCYLDADRQPVDDGVCEFGGTPQSITTPADIDAEFCGTVQDFHRRGAGGATGEAALDELNGFVYAAPSTVERLIRELVSAVSSGDDDARLRAGLELDRTIVWSCDEALVDELLRLIGAAIEAVPPAPPPPPAGGGGEEQAPDPGQLDGGSPYVELCVAIEARFPGSAPEQWGQVLAIANGAGAPANVISILTQLADPNVVGDETRVPLVAALQPFVDGPCQDTGLDQGSGPGPAGTAPPTTAPEDDGVPELL